MFPCVGQNGIFSIVSRISHRDLNTIANLEDLTSLEVTVFIGKNVSEGMVDSTKWEQDQVTRVEDFVLVNAWRISITHKYEHIHLTFVLQHITQSLEGLIACRRGTSSVWAVVERPNEGVASVPLVSS